MVGWPDGRIAPRAILLTLAFLSAYPPIRLSAQWRFHGGLGARIGTPLVEDNIVNPITLKTSVGISGFFGLSTPTNERWAGEATLDFNGTGLNREELGETQDVGGLVTLSFAVLVRRDLNPRFSARAGLGAIAYIPYEDSGVFNQGSGGVKPLALAAVRWAAWRQGPTLNGLELRYDVHRFTTPALRDAGFETERFVHRVMIAVTTQLGGRSTP